MPEMSVIRPLTKPGSDRIGPDRIMSNCRFGLSDRIGKTRTRSTGVSSPYLPAQNGRVIYQREEGVCRRLLTVFSVNFVFCLFCDLFVLAGDDLLSFTKPGPDQLKSFGLNSQSHVLFQLSKREGRCLLAVLNACSVFSFCFLL